MQELNLMGKKKEPFHTNKVHYIGYYKTMKDWNPDFDYDLTPCEPLDHTSTSLDDIPESFPRKLNGLCEINQN